LGLGGTIHAGIYNSEIAKGRQVVGFGFQNGQKSLFSGGVIALRKRLAALLKDFFVRLLRRE